jgi:hypothetical protein
MKRKRRAGQSESSCYRPGWKAFGGMPYKQTKDVEARFLRQRRQGINCSKYLHISRTVEI